MSSANQDFFQLSQTAQDFWLQEDYATAIALYEQAIALTPDDLSSYWHLGLMHLLQDDLEVAQSIWFTAISEIAPAHLDAAIAQLGQILRTEAQRQFDRKVWHLAERIYSQLLEFDPPATVLLDIGRVCAYQGNLDDAITAWQNVIALQPDHATAYCELGQVHQKLAQFPEAIAAYTAAIAQQPTGTLHHQLGLCLAQTQQWPAAIHHLQQALQLSPTVAAIQADLGQVLLQQSDWAGAIDHWHQAIYRNPPCDQDWAQQYCRWAQAQSQPELIVNVEFLQALATPEPNLRTKLILASLLVRTDQIQIAIALYEQIRQCYPDQPEATAALVNLSLLMDADAATETLSLEPPSGLYPTTAAWHDAQPKAGTYIPLDAGSWLDLAPPQTIDPEIHFSFRFPHQIPLEGTFVTTIPQGSIWINSKQSSNAVLTGDRQLLADLSPEFPLFSPGHPEQLARCHSRFTANVPSVHKMAGPIVVLAGLCNDMYFHWMFDVLPRLDLLDRSGIDRDAIAGWLISHHLPFQQETLAHLGIPAAKILTPEQYPHLQADHLIVPSFPGSPAWMPQWACQWLRQQFLDDAASQSAAVAATRLYISRKDTTSRRIINETAVMELLRDFGFQCVTLESRSVPAQAALLTTAEVVISPHGGGLTNLVFCRPGTKVIEIFPPHFVYPCYWLVSNLVDLRYYYLVGSAPYGSNIHQLLYPNARLEDIFVDLDTLRNLLKLACIEN
jgi:capsular polysaccharide biosynthesis protein/tetratricopeptide (TPR) repeat protein